MKKKGIQLVDHNDEGGIMDLKIMPKRDSQGMITEGLVVGETLEQNMALILMAHLGDFKTNPDLGVGLGDMLLGENALEYRSKIREHFAKDGLKIITLDLYEGKPFKIDADYE